MPPKKKASTRKTKATLAAEAAAAAAAAAAAEVATIEAPAVESAVAITTDETTAAAATNQGEEEEEVEKETVTETVKVKATRTKARKAVTKTTTIATTVAPAEEEHEKAAPSAAAETSNDQDQDQEMAEAKASPSDEKGASATLTMAQRMEKLKGLRQKLNASKQANRADLMTEHQKSKVNRREESKKERALEDAEKLIAKRDAEEAGEDYERSQFWNYSAESVERWNEKQESKRVRMDNKFTDWDQVNHKKYLKQVGELKPNLAAYNAKKEAAMHTNEDGELVVASDSGFYRDANSVAFLSDAKPDALAVDRLAADVAKQIDARTRFSKRRAHKEDEDVNYINDANQRFNQKISRFYDKYTKDIRDDFERGTAL
ncbi:SYF2 splicing factor-domain-containing protein [Dissophora ornata]|nr:SYF2 splicing factor-domain-containing protein [Dissophora ornata]